MEGKEKEEKKKDTFNFRVKPLAGVPYKFCALCTNFTLINYIRGCNNFQDQWAEVANYYFYSYLNKRHPSN